MPANAPDKHNRRQTPATIDPVEQPSYGDGDDATSGSEGGGPRIGYSEPAESDRLKFPRPRAPQPREGE